MELKDRIQISSLLSEYGSLLTEKQRDMLSLYANMDMSLFEIAEEYGISRQAVRDAISHATVALENYEESVGKLKMKAEIKAELDKITAESDELKARLQTVYDILEG